MQQREGDGDGDANDVMVEATLCPRCHDSAPCPCGLLTLQPTTAPGEARTGEEVHCQECGESDGGVGAPCPCRACPACGRSDCPATSQWGAHWAVELCPVLQSVELGAVVCCERCGAPSTHCTGGRGEIEQACDWRLDPRPPGVCSYCFTTECDGRCDGWLLAGEQWDRDATFAAQAVVLQEWADQSLVVGQLLRALDRRYGGGRAISDILAPQLMPPQYPHVPWWYMDGEVPESGGDEEGVLDEWWPGADHMVWWDEGSQEWHVPEGEQGQWGYEGGN
jgi:hypothetical protein